MRRVVCMYVHPDSMHRRHRTVHECSNARTGAAVPASGQRCTHRHRRSLLMRMLLYVAHAEPLYG